MKVMNQLIKLPELQKTMLTMSREMERAGLIEEMVSSTMDELDGDDVEDETALEIDKVVTELTGDLFKGKEADSALPSALPARPQPAEAEAAPAPAEADEDLETMKARLMAL